MALRQKVGSMPGVLDQDKGAIKGRRHCKSQVQKRKWRKCDMANLVVTKVPVDAIHARLARPLARSSESISDSRVQSCCIFCSCRKEEAGS